MYTQSYSWKVNNERNRKDWYRLATAMKTILWYSSEWMDYSAAATTTIQSLTTINNGKCKNLVVIQCVEITFKIHNPLLESGWIFFFSNLVICLIKLCAWVRGKEKNNKFLKAFWYWQNKIFYFNEIDAACSVQSASKCCCLSGNFTI